MKLRRTKSVPVFGPPCRITLIFILIIKAWLDSSGILTASDSSDSEGSGFKSHPLRKRVRPRTNVTCKNDSVSKQYDAVYWL